MTKQVSQQAPAAGARRTGTAATLSTITFSAYNSANYSTAKAKFYDTDVVRDFFYKHNEKCTKIAKEFKMTVFDCVKAEM